MSPHEFSKMMRNPYFSTDHFRNESKAIEVEKKVEQFFIRKALMISKLFTWPIYLYRAYRKRKPF